MKAMTAAGKVSDAWENAVVTGCGVLGVFDDWFAAHPANFRDELFDKHWVQGAAARVRSVKTVMEKKIIFGVMDEFAPFDG